MRVRSLRLRTLLIGVAALALLLAAGIRWFRGTQYGFNVVVSRAVPKGATLADLEAVAGPAIRPPAADRLAAAIGRAAAAKPDGWREGDSWACYDFPDGNRWWFQVRDGRLVNYDPAVLASQPQPGRPSLIR